MTAVKNVPAFALHNKRPNIDAIYTLLWNKCVFDLTSCRISTLSVVMLGKQPCILQCGHCSGRRKEGSLPPPVPDWQQ